MKTLIKELAEENAKKFSDPDEIPAKYRQNVKKKKFKEESQLLKDFEIKIKDWELTLNNIFNHFSFNRALRIAKSEPVVEPELNSVVDAEAFNEINNYLISRREMNCCDGELGCLALLSYDIQLKVEEQIGLRKKRILKNPEAQKLLELKQVEVDGVQINLWQHHSIDTVRVQQGWNKVRSYTERNSQVTGENGDITFTGVMQIPRAEAEHYALCLGFKVHSHISKNIEFVVVGSENVSPSKLAKVIGLQKEGAPIRVMSELEFLEMVSDNMDQFEIQE